jgi:hypothetical protein
LEYTGEIGRQHVSPGYRNNKFVVPKKNLLQKCRDGEFWDDDFWDMDLEDFALVGALSNLVEEAEDEEKLTEETDPDNEPTT